MKTATELLAKPIPLLDKVTVRVDASTLCDLDNLRRYPETRSDVAREAMSIGLKRMKKRRRKAAKGS